MVRKCQGLVHGLAMLKGGFRGADAGLVLSGF